MRPFLLALLVGAACAAPGSTATADTHDATMTAPDRRSADAPASSSYVYLGMCTDDGAWVAPKFDGLPACKAGPASATIKALQGMTMRADHSPKAEVTGQLSAHANATLLRIHVSSSTPGNPHAVWGEIATTFANSSDGDRPCFEVEKLAPPVGDASDGERAAALLSAREDVYAILLEPAAVPIPAEVDVAGDRTTIYLC